jgi:hypothetical protein
MASKNLTVRWSQRSTHVTIVFDDAVDKVTVDPEVADAADGGAEGDAEEVQGSRVVALKWMATAAAAAAAATRLRELRLFAPVVAGSVDVLGWGQRSLTVRLEKLEEGETWPRLTESPRPEGVVVQTDWARWTDDDEEDEEDEPGQDAERGEAGEGMGGMGDFGGMGGLEGMGDMGGMDMAKLMEMMKSMPDAGGCGHDHADGSTCKHLEDDEEEDEDEEEEEEEEEECHEDDEEEDQEEEEEEEDEDDEEDEDEEEEEDDEDDGGPK